MEILHESKDDEMRELKNKATEIRRISITAQPSCPHRLPCGWCEKLDKECEV